MRLPRVSHDDSKLATLQKGMIFGLPSWKCCSMLHEKSLLKILPFEPEPLAKPDLTEQHKVMMLA